MSSVNSNSLQVENVLPTVRPAPVRLRSNALWMLVGNSVGSLARWLIVVIIAKLGTQETVGQFGWALAFCLPTITIFRFGARILLSTDANNEIPFSKYFSFTLLGSILGFLAVVVVAGLNQLDASTIALVTAIALWNSVESISDLFGGLFQRLERMEYVAKANLVQLIPMCVAMILGVLWADSIVWAAYGLVFAALIRLVAYELPVAATLLHQASAEVSGAAPNGWALLCPRFDRVTFRRLLILGAPLAIVTFLLAYTGSVPRYIIKDYLDNARVGVFFALYSVAVAQNLIVGSVAQSIAPRMATYSMRSSR